VFSLGLINQVKSSEMMAYSKTLCIGLADSATKLAGMRAKKEKKRETLKRSIRY
jgi:hypothetical protein